jgi:futalosine hydrolase
MHLLVAATDFECDCAKKLLLHRKDIIFLTSGVGPVETAFNLTSFLTKHSHVSAVINFGVAGAFVKTNVDILDVCLAKREVLADLGICFTDRIDSLATKNLTIKRTFDLQNSLFQQAQKVLIKKNKPFHAGTFVTVNCVSGTQKRGNLLQQNHQAICENMEGAAIARVCLGFGLDCLEIRVISNMVEDRDQSKWQLKQACQDAGQAVTTVVEGLI